MEQKDLERAADAAGLTMDDAARDAARFVWDADEVEVIYSPDESPRPSPQENS